MSKREDVVRIFRNYTLGLITLEEATRLLSQRSTTLGRDLLLFLIGFCLGMWVGALAIYSP